MEGNKSSTSVVNVVVVLLNRRCNPTGRIANLKHQFHRGLRVAASPPLPLSLPLPTIKYFLLTHHQLALPVVLEEGRRNWRRVYRGSLLACPALRPACFSFIWLDWMLDPKGVLLVCRLAVWRGLAKLHYHLMLIYVLNINEVVLSFGLIYHT